MNTLIRGSLCAALLVLQPTLVWADQVRSGASEAKPPAACIENPQTTTIDCPSTLDPKSEATTDRNTPAADDAPTVRDLDLRTTLPISSSVELPDDI